MQQPVNKPAVQVGRGLLLLSVSALLFASMGVLIRLASHTVDNATIVFFRNAVGLLWMLPLALMQGSTFWKTQRFSMHAWRAIVGLAAMYGFFYAIAHLKLANAMVFTYSSPVFIPLIAWLFLKEQTTKVTWAAAALGLIGVILVAKPDQGFFNILSGIGLISSLLAATAFVTVRAMTDTEPATRIVFYFCLIATLISALPMFWHWRPYQAIEWLLLIGIGSLATLSQIFLSKAYAYAPASQIGPATYLAIVFAGIWAVVLWDEWPDWIAVSGMGMILLALVLCMPYVQQRLRLALNAIG